MRHLGDITKINGDEVPLVDIITGGSPCQDLSVAGKREGLRHAELGDNETTRSGLFMEQIRIIKEMREHDRANKGADVDFRLLRPRFMVWENVPGAFSSNGGEDFRAVLEETAKVVERDACIPRIEGGAEMDTIRMHHGRWVEHCLASTRCTVLGSSPKKKTYRSCRRFWRFNRTRNTL